jgi:signal transduction histidine kinase
MTEPERVTSIRLEEKEQHKLRQLKRSVDETLRQLVGDYRRMEELNRELETRAKTATMDLEQTRSKLRSAHRDLDAFQRREAHLLNLLFKGLKSPLSHLERNIEKLSNGGKRKRPSDSLDVIQAEVHRLWKIVSDLATVEAVQLGADQLKQERVDLRGLIRRVVADHQQMAKGQHVLLNPVLSDGLPAVVGDRERLKMALNHLLSNAIAHSPSGGAVTIAANGDPPKDCVQLSLMDTRRDALGDPNLLALQGRPHLRRDFDADAGGLDLELLAAWQIIAMHKGEIAVRSQAGKETVFTLTLPADKRPERTT